MATRERKNDAGRSADRGKVSELPDAAPDSTGLTPRQQLLGNLGMPSGAGKLQGRLTVPLEAEPGQAVIDCLNRILGRTLSIGVLDAQKELALLVARIGPREQRRAGAADVQVAGGRRGEAGNDLLGH